MESQPIKEDQRLIGREIGESKNSKSIQSWPEYPACNTSFLKSLAQLISLHLSFTKYDRDTSAQ